MVRKPNAFLYFIAFILIYPVLKILFCLKVDRSCCKLPKGPYIVLSNHESFIDFLLVMLALYPHRLNAVTAQKYFNFRPLNWLLPLMGAIPKYLFETDMHAVFSIMKVIRRGDRLLIFPEGRDSVHGPYMGMIKSTGKLIKKLQVPVLSCNIEGSYNCAPFWRKGFRCGRIRVTFANLFSEEDIQRLTVEEINNQIDVRLSGKDVVLAQESPLEPPLEEPRREPRREPLDEPLKEPQRETMEEQSLKEFRRNTSSSPKKPLTLLREKKLAEGLENILYYCPVCQREFTLETRDNTISCTACRSRATMDRKSVFSAHGEGAFPKTIADWYKAQVLHERQKLQEDIDLVRAEVLVSMPLDGGRGFTIRGNGTLRLDNKGWHFDGELDGEKTQLFFPINTVPVVPFEPNYSIQICRGKDFYDFIPRDNPRASAKYATIGECAYWRFASNIQITPGKDSGFSQA